MKAPAVITSDVVFLLFVVGCATSTSGARDCDSMGTIDGRDTSSDVAKVDTVSDLASSDALDTGQQLDAGDIGDTLSVEDMVETTPSDVIGDQWTKFCVAPNTQDVTQGTFDVPPLPDVNCAAGVFSPDTYTPIAGSSPYAGPMASPPHTAT